MVHIPCSAARSIRLFERNSRGTLSDSINGTIRGGLRFSTSNSGNFHVTADAAPALNPARSTAPLAGAARKARNNVAARTGREQWIRVLGVMTGKIAVPVTRGTPISAWSEPRGESTGCGGARGPGGRKSRELFRRVARWCVFQLKCTHCKLQVQNETGSGSGTPPATVQPRFCDRRVNAKWWSGSSPKDRKSGCSANVFSEWRFLIPG